MSDVGGKLGNVVQLACLTGCVLGIDRVCSINQWLVIGKNVKMRIVEVMLEMLDS